MSLLQWIFGKWPLCTGSGYYRYGRRNICHF